MSTHTLHTNRGLTACIVAGGTVTPGPRVMAALDESDIIIAADRGVDVCLDLGITPTLCIGDFDSVSDAGLQTARARGWPIQEYPSEKAATDGELALDEAVAKGVERIYILGALAGPDRFDHMAANLLMLARPDLVGIDVRLIDERHQALLLRNGESETLVGARGDYVTLLPLSEAGATVTTWGLKYDLLGITLRYGSTRGVSNELIWQRANITIEKGHVLILHEQTD